MNWKGAINASFVISLALLGFLVSMLPPRVAVATALITTSTSTIPGWLVPDATHFSNGLLAVLIPLGVSMFFVAAAGMFKSKGDATVHALLGGLFIGSVVSDLSATSSATSALPFGMIVISGLLWFFWWWNS